MISLFGYKVQLPLGRRLLLKLSRNVTAPVVSVKTRSEYIPAGFCAPSLAPTVAPLPPDSHELALAEF